MPEPTLTLVERLKSRFADVQLSIVEARGEVTLEVAPEHWLATARTLRDKQLGVAGVVAMLGTGLYTASTGGDEKAPEAPAATKLDMGAGLRGDSLETKLRGDLKKILDGQTLLGDRVTAIEEGKVVPGSKPGAPPDGDPGLPPALPGAIPDYPPAPSDAEIATGEIPPPPSPPAAPPAPPAPPVEKAVGAIGAAVTAPGTIAAADGKEIGRAHV